MFPSSSPSLPDNTTPEKPVVPAVWIGCLHCYNDGDLVGAWIEADEYAHDPDFFDPVRIRAYSGASASLTPSCEELWVFEHESIPAKRELGPLAAAAWGRVYIDMFERGLSRQWAALCARADAGAADTDSNGMPDFDKFEEAYRGAFAVGFEEYAYQLIDEISLMDGWPETAKNYFNYESYIRDLAMDLTVLKAPAHGPDAGSTHVWANY